ncbi:hypothetical protein WG906_13840 [Pedobacter sp. P351]|uniref:hypothetical protein n=1 Tax=Pedobacter superstes TaxID=3133441 RepID=UPI0030A9F172
MRPHRYLLWIRFTAILSIIVAVMVIAGWLFDIESLKTFGAPITMKFNTGLGFLILGSSVWFLLQKRSTTVFMEWC